MGRSVTYQGDSKEMNYSITLIDKQKSLENILAQICIDEGISLKVLINNILALSISKEDRDRINLTISKEFKINILGVEYTGNFKNNSFILSTLI